MFFQLVDQLPWKVFHRCAHLLSRRLPIEIMHLHSAMVIAQTHHLYGKDDFDLPACALDSSIIARHCFYGRISQDQSQCKNACLARQRMADPQMLRPFWLSACASPQQRPRQRLK